MNAKNRLIERLLQSAKKHKILTYPVLAVVAIISFFGNLFNWRNGAGKRVVAIIMVMVMFVSQSYFLTSSATALVDTEEEALIQKEIQDASVEKEDEITTEAPKEEPEKTPKEESAETTQKPAETVAEVPDQDSSEDVSAPDADAVSTEDGEETTTEEKDAELDSKLDGETKEIRFAFNYSTKVGEGQFSGSSLYVPDETISVPINATTADLSSILTNQAYLGAVEAVNDSDAQYSLDTSAWYSDLRLTHQVDIKNVPIASNGYAMVYCRRELVKYKVSIIHGKVAGQDATDWSTDPEYTDGVTPNASYYIVDIEEGSNPKRATLNLSGIRREGYSLYNVEMTGSGRVEAVEKGEVGSATISLTGDVGGQTVTLIWQPNEYYLDYYDKDGKLITNAPNWNNWQVEFDDTTDRFWVGDAGTIGLVPGYFFAGKWKVGSVNSTDIVTGGESVTFAPTDGTIANPYYKGKGSHVSLYPVFEYAGICLNESEDTTFTDVNMSYKSDRSSDTYYASYKKSNAGNGDFKISVADDDSRNNLTDYGLELVKVKNGFYFKPNGDSPKKAGTCSVKVMVEDSNARDEDSKETEFTINLIIAKCKISAVPGSLKNTKQYDGNARAPFAGSGIAQLDTVDSSNHVSEVIVECSTNNAAFNSPNAREANKIIFDGSYTLKYKDSGENASENYELVTVEGGKCYIPGTITPVQIQVVGELHMPESSTAYGIDYIRTGEDDPTYTFTVADGQTKPGDLPDSWLQDISYTTDRVDKNLVDDREYQEYQVIRVDIKTDSEDVRSGNYVPTIDTNQLHEQRFKVKQEDAVGNYVITGMHKTENNEWYYGSDISVKALESTVYDTVYISTNGENGTYNVLREVFEDYSNNGDVWIYLYSSITHAFTKRVPLGLLYDGKAPEYIGYEFTQQGEDGNSLDFSTEGFNGSYDGLYFPGIGGVMDFGTYTKSTIQLKVIYEDKTSGLKRLRYGLFGDEPNQTADFIKLDDTRGYAVITVLADMVPRIGTIKCYAEDNAGNESTPVISLSPTGDNGNYEWSVEADAPKIDNFAIKYRVGTNNGDYHYETIYSSREWYNHCRAELKVSDATAGLHAINWYINGELADTTSYTSKVTTSDTVIKEIPANGSSDAYRVYAEILDNAGNSQKTQEYQLKIDDVMPVLTVYYDGSEYTQDNKIMFTVRDDLSGVNYVRVSHMVNGEMRTQNCDLGNPNEDGLYTASFNVDTKGVYVVTAVDHAGNVHEWSREINTISREVPDCPKITFAPSEPNGANGWYNTIPAVTIQNVKFTADQTPVTTKYQMWKDDNQPMMEATVSGDGETRNIPGDGIYYIKAWSRSASGVDCISSEGDQVQVKVDTIEPTIDFTTGKGSGASIIVDFTVTDIGSGVDASTVRVMHGAKEIVAEVAEENGVCTGSFEITETGDYTISVADFAGNVAQTAAFTPMSMKVKAVKNITTNSAVLGANVYKGTFDIQNVSIAYRKISDANYTQAEALPVKDDNGNWSISTVLSSLSENTAYVYKVTAVSTAPADSIAGEVLEYEGYFKTLSSNNAGITITGTARYATSREGAVTVGIFEGNVCIMATEINAGEEFTFSNVPDGNYSVIATDGVYSKTMRLLIKDGVVIYPTKYIDLILSGKNTSVVITSTDTPHVTADNMDSIFDDDPVNYTTDDQTLIEAGGTVEFRLYATLMSVSSVSANEISAMYAVTDGNKIVGAYLDLSLYKIITDADGKVERERVTELANGANVSVTIPLGDLAGKSGLEIVRIHDTGDAFVGASLRDMDNNPNTYTITTTQFSTYAVLYDPEAKIDDPIKDDNPTEDDGNIVIPAEEGIGNSDLTGDDGASPNGSNASVGTLKSSGSAKTGDTAPVAALGMLVFAGIAGFVTLRKKYK
ncbi:MAG: hypothetical protein K2L07_11685 [Lachnospiraceae bacterium]|nr:hypothetical protein [Lachnospiraceae bacterium]